MFLYVLQAETLIAFVLYYLFKKILAVVTAVGNKVFFVSDPGVSCLWL